VSSVEEELRETVDETARGTTETPFPLYLMVLIVVGAVAAVVIAVVLTVYLAL
jgi:hypothetical protein